MVRKLSKKVRTRFIAFRNKLRPQKDTVTISSDGDCYDDDDYDFDDIRLARRTPFTTPVFPLNNLPIEIIVMIVLAIINLPDFCSAAAFAKTSRFYRELVYRTLDKLYRAPVLPPEVFRNLLLVDYGGFGPNELKELRRDWWHRWLNDENPYEDKYWQKTLEAKLLSGRNCVILYHP